MRHLGWRATSDASGGVYCSQSLEILVKLTKQIDRYDLAARRRKRGPVTEPKPTFIINADEAQVPAYVLPDALLMPNGEPIRRAAIWRERWRAQILGLFQTHVYGTTPSAGGRCGSQ